MWLDTKTGKKYKKLKSLRKDVIEVFREDPAYFEDMGESLAIPYDIFEWICGCYWDDFKEEFSAEINRVEDYFFENYVSDWVEKVKS